MKKEGTDASAINPGEGSSIYRNIVEIYSKDFVWNELPKKMVDFSNGKVLSILGRTVLFQPAHSSSTLAFKFRKNGESLNEFCREKEITELYRQTVHIKSTLPKPLAVSIPSSLPAELAHMDLDREQPALYIQEVENSYYTYLHTIEDDQQWSIARLKFLHDSGFQIAHGQIPPFVELYHNEETVRKYQPLSNLIPKINRGAGRLEAPFAKTRYPNAGLGGIRDVGDGPHLSDVVEDTTKEAFDLFTMKFGKTHYMLMNAIAKLMLVDSLLLIQRLERQSRIDWEDHGTVQFVETSLKEGYSEILAGFTQKLPEECMSFLQNLPFSFERQAKQLLFWAQTDDRGYPAYLRSGVLPPGLYDDEMSYTIDLNYAGNYHAEGYFSSSGEKDFGCYNGPLGWVEHEKGWYWVSTFAVSVYLHENASIDSDQIHEQDGSGKRLRRFHQTLHSRNV